MGWPPDAGDDWDELGDGVLDDSVVVTCGTKGSFALNSVKATSFPVSARRAPVSGEIEMPARTAVDLVANTVGVVAVIELVDWDAATADAGSGAGGLICFHSFGPWIATTASRSAPPTATMIFCLRAFAAAMLVLSLVTAIRASLLQPRSRSRTDRSTGLTGSWWSPSWPER